ncbi:hypothetical protein Q8F55_002385 [Vanrija albida]|uniref:Origin recognition complex subunit 3 winged helix C-terminal domain-containing protein n=1 Tax=Vanrija albida TaxID=181172 RepID=A0ABR3Q9P0_9TREE
MGNDFHSLSQGVFVIPFQPPETKAKARPSSTAEPLDEIYDKSYQHFQAAYDAYEEQTTAELLDEIRSWLQQCDIPPSLKPSFDVQRLHIALVQGVSAALTPGLSSITRHAVTINGRDVSDLASATRAVAVGFLGEAALAAKKAGRTPMEEVQRWWQGQKDRKPLLVHIQQAQLISSTVLSELIYIMNLYPTLPFRLLLDVPSIGHFLSTWTLVEPSEVDLSILTLGRSRKRNAGVNAILQSAVDSTVTPLSVTRELAEQLKRDEEMIGGGSASTLKSLRWLALQHRFNSPLAALAESEVTDQQLRDLQTIADVVKDGNRVPGGDIFALDANSDLSTVNDPAPRMSILSSLAKPDTFWPASSNGVDASDQSVAEDEQSSEDEEVHTPRKSSRSRQTKDYLKMSGQTTRKKRKPQPPADDQTHAANGEFVDLSTPQPFKETETLFSLWQSAGRNVNLWDWLEGFRGELTGSAKEQGNEENGSPAERRSKRKRAGEDEDGVPELSEEAQQRLHAAFIRFVEEARMLGLVRARAKGTRKKTDEVVKGVLLV